jgi:hypothetical protein
MLRLTGWTKWVAALLIAVMLLSSSCSLIASSSNTTIEPPPTTPPEPENQKPVIQYIQTEQQVTPSSSTRITCMATDADKDTLTYSWSSNNGTIIGTGDTVTWIAPEAAGTYSVTAMVTDGKGGEAKDSVTINVIAKANRAPIVTLLFRENKNAPPITVTPEMDPIRIKKWSTPEIECKAEDPDGDPISYKWSATEGKIEGEGPIVQFIAMTAGDITVTVTAVDSRGAQTKASVYFKVPCCGGFK